MWAVYYSKFNKKMINDTGMLSDYRSGFLLIQVDTNMIAIVDINIVYLRIFLQSIKNY